MYSVLEKPQLREQSGPCECSQSEVTFLSSEGKSMFPSMDPLKESKRDAAAVPGLCLQTDLEPELDLYGSCPVECSCAAGAEAQGCEDCWANGFSHTASFIPPGM